MERKVRVLGIAPYEGMRNLMESLAKEYPEIELTTFVGDLEQGVEIAKNNFYGNFDVVISRGGTARMLCRHIELPVIEIATSMYDILCALKLSDGQGGRIAMVCYSNIATETKLLCDLMSYDIDIHTIESPEEVSPVLRRIQQENYQAILCDVIADVTAKQLGLNSFLITSGVDSIRRAYNQALLLCRSQERLRDENLFFRTLLSGQIGHTVVFQPDGTLYLSTLETISPELLDLLRQELPDSMSEPERRLTRLVHGTMYSIRTRRIVSGSLTFAAFFFVSSKSPISLNRPGIHFYTRREVESRFLNSIFSFAGAFGRLQKEIEQLCQSSAPVMIAGEDGAGKESVANKLYMLSDLRHNSFVEINCNLLNEKSWLFLLEHHNSPLAGEKNTICLRNVDALPPERLQQLMASCAEMDVCQRNRVLFTCISPPGKSISDCGAQILNHLGCRLLYLEPLRKSADRIPMLINLTLSHLNMDRPTPLMGAEPLAVSLLQTYPWPYNYTQFRRVIEELAAISGGPLITAADVNRVLRKEYHEGSFSPLAENSAAPLDLNRPLDEINRDIALRVLEEKGGNQTATAQQLGVSRTTLWRMLRK